VVLLTSAVNLLTGYAALNAFQKIAEGRTRTSAAAIQLAAAGLGFTVSSLMYRKSDAKP